jgi:hypothetical protein
VRAGDQWSLQGFGATIGDGPPVDLAQAIARWLLDGREAEVLGVHDRLEGFDALLVMGDGSASRTDKAPRHLNPHAIAFDQAVLDAVATGDLPLLVGIDLTLAEEVGAAGAPAWQHLAGSVERVESSGIDCSADPYGVLYFVARWTARWAVPA